MHRLYRILVGLLLVSASSGATLELAGFLHNGEDDYFTLYDREARVTSEWLKVGAVFQEHKLVAYHRANGLLQLRRGEHTLQLAMRLATFDAAAPAPAMALDLAAQLRVEEASLAKLRERYREAHPTVIAQKQKVEALRQPLRPGETLELRLAEAELARLSRVFAATHPLVRRQQEKVAALRP